MTLIDTNVLIDLATNDPVWGDWSQVNLEKAALRGPLFVNEIVYAELSVGFARREDLDEFLINAEIELVYMPTNALFLAGKAFAQYGRGGGSRSSILADFFIGAHAAVSHLPLLTRDSRKYRTYFRDIEIIVPEDGNP